MVRLAPGEAEYFQKFFFLENCVGGLTVSFDPPLVAGLSLATTRRVTVTARDALGHTASCNVKISWIFTFEILPDDLTLEADANCQAVFNPPLAGAGACLGFTFTSDPPLPRAFSLGKHVVQYTTTDTETGDQFFDTQTVTVVDRTPPVINNPPDVTLGPRSRSNCLV
ncbi:MAG: hypothetical protein HY314_10795 [Acidobacteria bacterium]|nr:hypothetical protein [Acidobacteriota bacterium]